MRYSSLSTLTTSFAKCPIRSPLIYLFHLYPVVLRMMLSLNQSVLGRAINGAVYIGYPITKMAQSWFLEEKFPVVEVVDGW